MKDDLISVIIPVYKVEKYLEKCLDSVTGNTYKKLEIICINDGSPDSCAEILERYAADDDRFMIVNQINQGVSSARNAGLKKACGEWICFIDSDDWIHPQFFEILLNIAKKTDADIVIGNYLRTKEFETPILINPDTVQYADTDLTTIYQDRNMKNYVWGKLYKHSIIKGHTFDIDISYCEDALFNAKIYSGYKNLKIFSTDEILYFYNDHESSAVNSIDPGERAKLGRIYIDFSEAADNSVIKKVFLLDGMKRTLLARFIESRKERRKRTLHQCDEILQIGIRKMIGDRQISPIEKAIYSLFVYVPPVYSCWRIIDDLSMKNLQKNQ